ncbi:hydrogenase, partial [Thermococcus sp. 21S9]|nr:hydrogenase [Thermococcus sp. 21S9]
MRYIKLSSENFEKFFNSLKALGKVYGPVKKGNIYSFQEVQRAEEMSLDYNRTMLPPKKFFVMPRDTILRLKNGRWENGINDEPFVLFGVHSCDIHGLKI